MSGFHQKYLKFLLIPGFIYNCNGGFLCIFLFVSGVIPSSSFICLRGEGVTRYFGTCGPVSGCESDQYVVDVVSLLYLEIWLELHPVNQVLYNSKIENCFVHYSFWNR